MRILLVEDDLMLGEALRQGLSRAAYATDWTREAASARRALEQEQYALLLLDLGLPDADGLSLLRGLREQGQAVPVLIITARDAVDARVCGLDAGADDYLIKPFALEELLARMRALLRRQAGAVDSELTHEGLRLNLATRELRVDEAEPLVLSAREFALMQALLSRPGVVFSRRQLEEALYGWDEEVESNVVEVIIHGLRKKRGAGLIKNLRGAGWLIPRERG